jgi:hypothetical protein
MSPQTPHARLLKEAAREVLEPLGLSQSGHARIWLDDRLWWLILVEFEPASFSRGTYLNVGAMWLWYEKDYLSFDVGYRIEGFTSFRNKSQFEREARRLASRAADKLENYRQQFPQVDAAAEYLLEHCDPRNPWDLYHAGVACGITGRSVEAARCLGHLTERASTIAWEKSLQRRAAQLRNLCGDTAGFRLSIEQTIATSRDALKLPPPGTAMFDGQPNPG